MKKNLFTSDVAEAAAYLCGDPSVAQEIRDHAAACAMVDALQSLRCRLGFGLNDFARRMGISRTALVRIEEGTDADLSPRIIAAYLSALVRPSQAETAKTATAEHPAPMSRKAAHPRKRPALAIA